MSYYGLPNLVTTDTFEGASSNSLPSVECVKNATASYGTCITGASIVEKAVSVPTFELREGANVTVRFSTSNSAAMPTLNVNNTGAYPIKYRNLVIDGSTIVANRVYAFVYTNGSYEIVGDLSISAAPSATSTIPEITGPDSAPINVATEYSFYSTCGLNSGTVTHFDVTFNGVTERIDAVDGTCTLTITIPIDAAEGDEFIMTATAYDNYGGSSNEASKVITAFAASVAAPTITSPASGVYVSPKTISVTTSDIQITSSSTVLTDVLAASFFKISTDTLGNDIVWESGRIESSSVTHTLTLDTTLTPTVTYYIWAKHEGETFGTSGWGTKVSVIASKTSAPAISSPTEGTYVNPSSIEVVTTDFTCQGGISDTHVASYYRVTSDANGNVAVFESGRLTDALTTYTIATDALEPGNTYYVFARHEGENTGISDWSAGISVVAGKVNTPTITSPVAGSEVVYYGGVTITTSAFSVSGFTDTHSSSDWKITSDSAGATVIAQDLESSDLLSHTFTNLTLTEGSTYYAWARHRGAATGVSEWVSVSFIALAGVTSSGGRLLYRHESGMGTVIEFTDGTARKVLVLDAAYRGAQKFGTYGKDSSLTNYQSQNTNNTWYINGGSSNTTPAACAAVTDATLNSLWVNSIDANTAKQNCDVWMTYEGSTDSQSISGVPAVRFARSKTVNGTPCDVPNLQTLMRIYCEAELLDDMDPTVAANPGNALGASNTNGTWKMNGAAYDRVWSSTEYTNGRVRYVNSNGNCSHYYKDPVLGVVPVLEL